MDTEGSVSIGQDAESMGLGGHNPPVPLKCDRDKPHKKNATCCFLSRLPHELISQIVSYLLIEEVSSLGGSCPRLAYLLTDSDTILMKQVLVNNIGPWWGDYAIVAWDMQLAMQATARPEVAMEIYHAFQQMHDSVRRVRAVEWNHCAAVQALALHLSVTVLATTIAEHVLRRLAMIWNRPYPQLTVLERMLIQHVTYHREMYTMVFRAKQDRGLSSSEKKKKKWRRYANHFFKNFTPLMMEQLASVMDILKLIFVDLLDDIRQRDPDWTPWHESAYFPSFPRPITGMVVEAGPQSQESTPIEDSFCRLVAWLEREPRDAMMSSRALQEGSPFLDFMTHRQTSVLVNMLQPDLDNRHELLTALAAERPPESVRFDEFVRHAWVPRLNLVTRDRLMGLTAWRWAYGGETTTVAKLSNANRCMSARLWGYVLLDEWRIRQMGLPSITFHPEDYVEDSEEDD